MIVILIHYDYNVMLMNLLVFLLESIFDIIMLCSHFYIFYNLHDLVLELQYIYVLYIYIIHIQNTYIYLCIYNPPENTSEITNIDQICATTIKNTLNPGFYHIRYDEKYMPELFLTLPELQNKQHYQLLMILLCF